MITVNGKEDNISEKILSEYLIESKTDMRRIAVELNGNIIPKKQYDKVILKDGDSLEIVSFVGGG